MSALFPRLDPVFKPARLYLCAKAREASRLAEFEAAIAKVKLTRNERIALVDEWKARVHNSGRMNGDRATLLAEKRERYAAGHAERARELVTVWLESHMGASQECDARITELSRALKRAL